MKSVKAFSTCSVSSLSVSTDGQKVAALSTSSELKTIKFNVRVRRKSFRGTHQRKTRLVKGKLFRLANQRKIYLLYSWRRTLPPILSKAFYQILGTCWAVGLIRQFEALLKKKGKLRDEEFLCIHSLIMKCAQLGIVKSEHKYGLVSYSDVEPVLRDVGANVIGADEEYILGENGLTKTFRIRELNIHVPLSTSATHLKQFEKLMIKDLSQGPLTVDIFAPDSYIMNEPGEIYSPTNGEAADIAKGYKSCVDGSCEYVEHHGLLLSGVHRLYWEFQGSYGTSQGDDGFFYIKRGLKIPTIAAFMRIVFEDDILPQTGNLRADLDLTKIL